MEDVKKRSYCLKCKKMYKNPSSLKRHVKKFHPGEINELAPGKYKNCSLYKYTCNFCQKNFNYKTNYQAHIKKHIPTPQQSPIKSMKKCPLCKYECVFKKEILIHFKNMHDIAINVEEHIFSSFKDFEDWKLKLEEETTSKFTIRSATNRRKYVVKYYVCHRSGYYVPSGDGKKSLKTKGSCKINGYCPAGITLCQKNQTIKVDLIRTHVGHENELGHLTLTPLERKKLASKIALRIPYDEILNEVCESVSEETLKRIHLLNRQDLYNVAKSLKLKSNAVRHQNDDIDVEIRVEAWINKMRKEGDTVLFYKAKGIALQEHPELKSEDFVLIIMTPAQKKILQKYGMDCICLDGTHGMYSYDFEMTTLVVLDELREGFPVAFLISNRYDKDVMTIFFSNILLKVGVIKASIFMTDLADSYFNAWIEVMGPPEKRLFCSWHLLRDWHKNVSKIKGKENRDIMLKRLRLLLEERDQETFEIMIENLCTLHNNPVFKDFKQYFKDNYFHNSQYWAYCYRSNSEIDANMHLESMHGVLKYIYLKGKKVERMDKAIHSIMRMVRDKLYDNKGKLSSKLEDIRQRHRTSNDLSMCIVKVKHGWEVQSQSRNEVYFIQEYINICSCKLVCSECETCIHKYRCSCLDSSIKFNMCKHSHLIAQFGQKTEIKYEESFGAASYDSELYENELRIVTNPKNENIMLKEIVPKSCSKTINEQKNNAREKIERLLELITEEKEMETLIKLLAPISRMTAVLKEKKKCQFSTALM